MTAQDGAKLLLSIGDGGVTEVFTPIGGMRATTLEVRGELLEASHAGSGMWRVVGTNAGTRSVRIGGSGMFTGSAAENTLREHALSGMTANWRVIFPDGAALTGPFLVMEYIRRGDVGAEEGFSLILESAGALLYT